MEKLLKYNTVVQAYSAPQKVVIDNLCNGITVRNAGNTILVFDDETLQPGQSKAIGGNRMEIFVGRKDLSFIPSNPVVIPTINLAFVTQKFYIRESLIKAGCLNDDSL